MTFFKVKSTFFLDSDIVFYKLKGSGYGHFQRYYSYIMGVNILERNTKRMKFGQLYISLMNNIYSNIVLFTTNNSSLCNSPILFCYLDVL